VVAAVVLPLPDRVVVLGAIVLLTFVALGGFWAPAMAMLSDASEEAGLDLALAFSLANIAWATGHLLGAGGGGAMADATSDAVPYALLGALCAASLAGLIALRRSAPARSPAAP
jgi:hypothetical protein